MKKRILLICLSIFALNFFFLESIQAFDFENYIVYESKPLWQKFHAYKKSEISFRTEILSKYLPNLEKKDFEYFKQQMFFESKLAQKRHRGGVYAYHKLNNLYFKKTEVQQERFETLFYARKQSNTIDLTYSFLAKRYAENIQNSYIDYQNESDLWATQLVKQAVRSVSKTELLSYEQQESKVQTQPEESANVELQLTILPVRFVYVDEKGDIVRIWNNVQRGDDVYVLKFFSQEDETELKSNDSLISNYFDLLTNIDMFAQGDIYDIDANSLENGPSSSFEISINYTNEGLTEIHTKI